jgi:serine/threonine-protein kinase
VYAFGLIMRDMLLGSRHAGPTTAFAELMARMQDAPPPMRTLDAAVPEAVDALVTRCLQPAPAGRYQTSSDLLRDLDRVAEGSPVETPPAAKPPRRGLMARGPMVAALAAIVAVLVLGAAAMGVRQWYAA